MISYMFLIYVTFKGFYNVHPCRITCNLILGAISRKDAVKGSKILTRYNKPAGSLLDSVHIEIYKKQTSEAFPQPPFYVNTG